jgi:hypothetical protein
MVTPALRPNQGKNKTYISAREIAFLLRGSDDPIESREEKYLALTLITGGWHGSEILLAL